MLIRNLKHHYDNKKKKEEVTGVLFALNFKVPNRILRDKRAPFRTSDTTCNSCKFYKYQIRFLITQVRTNNNITIEPRTEGIPGKLKTRKLKTPYQSRLMQIF